MYKISGENIELTFNKYHKNYAFFSLVNKGDEVKLIENCSVFTNSNKIEDYLLRADTQMPQ